MFLDKLHEVNRLVKAQLAAARLSVQHIEPHTEFLPTMDFNKSDHSLIQVKVPAHRFNLELNDQSRTTSDCANKIVQFILDAANEFSRPRIHLSLAYMNYSPVRGLNPTKALSFDIAIWEYDGDEMRWMETGEPRVRTSDEIANSHSIGLSSTVPVRVDSQRHELTKIKPFEVNIWTANILRDVAGLSVTQGSASQYLIKLEQDLLAGARNAAQDLSRMQRAAQAHDTILLLFRAKQYQEAVRFASQVLGQEVTLHTDGLNYLNVNDRLYSSDQSFALFAGIEVPLLTPQDLEERHTEDAVRDLAAWQRAAGVTARKGTGPTPELSAPLSTALDTAFPRSAARPSDDTENRT